MSRHAPRPRAASAPLLDTDPGIALSRLAARWEREATRALAPLGMTQKHYEVLRALSRLQDETDDAVSHRAVARAAQLDDVTVTRAMQALDDRGWVDRSPDGADARAWRVLISVSGKAQLDRATTRIRAVSRTYFDDDVVQATLRLLAPSGR
jgi:DNA-binding MarR family transcriptional regulator